MLNLLLLQAVPAVPIDTWLTTLPSLGVGGVLAGIMFFFYRSDRKEAADRLEKFTDNFMEVIQENTRAMTKLTEAINSKPR